MAASKVPTKTRPKILVIARVEDYLPARPLLFYRSEYTDTWL